MNPTQPPPQQPLQTPPEINVSQPKPNYLKTIIFSILGVLLVASVIYLYLQNQQLKSETRITNFKECSAVKGARILEIYPGKCILPSGKSFEQELTPEQQSRLIPPESNPTLSISNSLDETESWKTYTNNNLNIGFKYPLEYKAPEENNNYISLISPLNSEPKKGNDLQNRELKIEIYVSDAEPNETLEGLIIKKKEQSNSLGVDIKILKEEAILVDGIKAVKQTWEGMGTGQTILFVNNNKEYGIMKYPAVTTRDVEFNQILSTFKFLKSS